MKVIARHIIMTIGLCILTLPLWSKVYTPTTLPMVHLEDRTRYTCNPDGILSANAVSTMDSIFYALEQQTGIQTIVAVVGEIDPTDCFEFAHALFTAQGVGQQGKDNGLVILLSIEERCIQFVTGYGLEGSLPDAICKRIQSKYMVHLLSDERWDEAMVAGSRALYNHLMGDPTLIDEERQEADEDRQALIGFMVFMVAAMLIFVVIGYIAIRKQSQCPKCKQHTLKRSGSMTIMRTNSLRRDQVTYTCTHCGHNVYRIEDHHIGGGGVGGGPIIGGGGRSFGGGSFGGSFGGGRSGGGGAGSRF